MKAVPRRLVVLGAGPAGVELAQVVRRLGGEAVLVEAGARVLAREPAALGEALGEALRSDGIELVLGVNATAAHREGDDYVLELDHRDEVRGDRLLVATGRRPRVSGFGLETVGAEADAHGIRVDEHLRAGERLWAIGDVTGILPLTHVGEYQGEVVASNILGEPRAANYEAVPRVTYTDPQAGAVGVSEDRFVGTVALSEIPKTATYTHAYAESNGFLTLVSDGERLTGVRSRRMAPADDAGDPCPRPARGSHRHDPTVPELLRNLCRGDQGTPPRDCRHAAACGAGSS
jgi:dihydrolipoamide dehydrogenase